ncbi:formate dehydrogenase accessory sulfurtransferase FdhD [Sphingomonas sp.]|uniref:formate dehydrogenase accessory sulfurtransferase FdhD n=1 Tax=Sphingomonas sp. TaxID=28214 RepID=UPI0025F94796|nr:formate dehydrogenase accessory sulfurtransferase FdhD [Sphingomonas sp.]
MERIAAVGDRKVEDRILAQECPVAIELNGIGYAVLMATPADLVDLGYGFCRSERLIDRADDLIDADIHDVPDGIILRLTLADHVADRIVARTRHRTSDSSCGICGIENLEQAMRPLPRVPQWQGDDAAVFTAASALGTCQPLNKATRAVHAAACCTRSGDIVMVREDVGRHNAFDKLIGAMARSGAGWDGGFALLSSRCSYELVEKAALAACPMLACVSAPTALAVRRAEQAGLALRAVVRADAMLKVPA